MTVEHEGLRKVAEAAPKGPWLYRPNQYDDWGFVRGGEETEYGFGVICQAKDPNALDREVLDSHRVAGTDPWEAPARHIATFDPPTVLGLLDAIATLTARLEAREAEIAGLRRAVERDVTRFEHCADMIAASFSASGTLRAERTVKAKHYALEARAALKEQAR